MGRDEAFRETFNAMAARLEERGKHKTSEGDRLNNPLPAILATTGGGKSFHFDEFGELSPADLDEFCSNSELREILKNSVSYCTTSTEIV